jgi:hypothetical protein
VLERARVIQEQSNKRQKKGDSTSIATALVLMQFEAAGSRRKRPATT